MSEFTQLEENWKKEMRTEFQAEYFRKLESFLISEKESGTTIYPPADRIYAAFNLTPFSTIKVVIIGQDPYHGPEQANGFCFSVSEGIKSPPSLNNIFKELKNDMNIPIPKTGNLEPWARQGVFLLNAILTVKANQPGSHQNKGWEILTNATIAKLSSKKTGLVFLLWGKFAQAKEVLIDSSKHVILKAAHPSPFSAYNGFFGCKHFSKTNEILKKQNLQEINWKIE